MNRPVRLSNALLCLTVFGLSFLAISSYADAQQLPTVWVGGPNPAPCYRSVQVSGKWEDRKVACYEVRPPTITLSEDGNGFLSALHWTTWTATRADATGLRFQRCWGYYSPGHRDPHCPVGTTKFGYNVPVTVFLAKPILTVNGLLFSVLGEAGQTRQLCVTPFGTGCNVPPPTTTTTPPPITVGGQWEYVGFSQSNEAVDIVRLTLVDFPPGHLTGSWSESAAPGFQPGLALNGTECAGCNGVAGAYSDDFSIVGSVQGGTFTIEVENNGGSSLSGALGNSTPYGATRYGCGPSVQTGELFLVSGSSAYLFFRPQGFPGVAVGRQVRCL